MPQYDGYVRISTQNDTSDAIKATEELGDKIAEAMNTRPVDEMSESFGNVGQAALSAGDIIKANLISDVVLQGVQRLGAALKDIAASSVSGAINNETAFAKVKTLLKGDDVQKYYDDLIAMSNRTGVAFTDLAESMYSALSAGVAQDSVVDFVEKSVALSKGGFTSAATAIDVVTSALNAYQMEITEATHVQDVLITTQNLGKTTVDELAGAMGRVIPTAKAVNVTFDQLGAMYATVTANGVATAESTTYLNAMIDELGKSGSTAEKAMMQATEGTALAGKKFSEISAIGYDITDVLKLMSEEAAETGLALSDMFSSSEGAKAANILLSNMEGFKANYEAMVSSTGAAADAAATMMDTTAEKANIARTQIDNLTSSIGETLLPTIGEASEQLSEVIQTDEFKETAEAIGEFAAGTLTFLLENIKLIGAGLAGVTAGVVAFKTASVITKVVASWQNAALQVTLFSNAQGVAALKTAALRGELTKQEIIYAVLSGKLDAATAKTALFNTTLAANPAGAIAAAIGLLVTGLSLFSMGASESANKTKELIDAANDLKKATADSIRDGEAEVLILERKAKRYEELRTSMNRTQAEQAELQDLATELQKTLGDEVSVVNTLTGEYNDLSAAVDNYTQKMRQQIKLDAMKDSALEAQKLILENEKQINELDNKLIKYQQRSGLEEALTMFGLGESSNSIAAQKIVLEQTNAELQKTIDDYFGEVTAEYSAQIQTGTAATNYDPSAHYRQKDLEAQKRFDEYQTKLAEQYAQYAELYDEERKAAKYSYDMGEMDAATYYATLTELRDNYLKVGSEEWQDANVELQKYYNSLTEDQQKALTKAYNEEKSLLQYKLRMGKLSEEQYYKELAKIRDKYLDKNSEAWRSAYLETYEYNQQMLKAASDTTLSALENVASARDSLTAKLTDFNKTFEKISETVPETIAVKGDFTVTTAEHEVEVYRMGADSIEDNIRVLEEYGAMLDTLKARGADDDTMNEILAMDVDEAMEFGSTLLSMSDMAWNDYFGSMAKLRQTAAEISARYYQGEVDSLRENFVDKMRAELEGLGSDMYLVGADVAAEFVAGWNEALGKKDLTIGQLTRSLSGTVSTAPAAAQQMTSTGSAATDKNGTSNGSITNHIPVYIGSAKVADVMIDAVNGEMIRTGKNVLLT